MKVLKICIGTWENASRDSRELSVCRDLGAEIVVLAKGNADDRGREDEVNGYKVMRYTTRPYKKLPVGINRIISIFQWAKYAATLKADVITGHDIGGWTIGWLSKFYSKKKKPVLVYDSHEFELGRNSKRSKIQLGMIKFWEKKCIKKSAFTIVVNDSIADEIVKIYKLKERPVVVRNIPNRWTVDESVCAEKRKELLEMFPEKDDAFLIMYHGAVVPGRDVERVIELVSINPEVKAVILGNCSDEYKKKLTDLVDSFGVNDRVAFHKAVPLVELWKYVGAVNVGMILARATCKNHLYSLPNKLFENIQAGTPVVCPNYPAFKSIVEKYKNGLMCDPEDMNSINECVDKLRTDNKLYNELKDNALKAKEELNWEKERNLLISAYSDLLK
ncbi:MAG: glycosyltransferase [Clostridiales bacterium]|nr:glycosyltransferase [Clostridiales bacterium]MBR5418290.1 glycosyltransferase [Clostridiales bacterium]